MINVVRQCVKIYPKSVSLKFYGKFFRVNKLIKVSSWFFNLDNEVTI